MEEKIPQEIIDGIIDKINEAIDIPFLNEKQEKMLFTLVLSVLIETILRIRHK